MFKKINAKTLLIIFVILLGLILFSKFFDSRQGERTFKSDLINIDSTAKATIGTVLLYPKAENQTELKFMSKNDKWEVQKDDIRVVADSNSIKSLLQEVLNLKAQQLVSNDKNSWKDFNVTDSLGTRLKILSKENDLLADVIIGRFVFSQKSRNGSTYVRLYDEDEVYSIEGFLSMNANQKFEQWRIKTIVSGKSEDWNKITFQYPADSNFVLIKQNNKWMVDTTKADSTKTITYLSRLANITSSGFVDMFNGQGKVPILTLKIEGNNLSSPIVVNAYEADTVNKYVINSSLNTDSYFGGAKDNLFQTIFFSKRQFMPVY